MALPGAGALLHPAAQSAVVDSAKRLLALAGALSPGADLRVLGRAMEELERLAAGGTATATDPSASTAADDDMDIDPSQPGGGTGAAARGRRGPGAKRKREARPGASQRTAKRRILAWRTRAARQYRSLVAKATATARRARSRRARALRPARPRRERGGWRSVAQQLARATLGDGLHRWSPGGGPAQQ